MTRRLRPSIESLEDRSAPSGWSGPILTWSIVPDGTVWSGGTSALVGVMGRKDANWRDDIKRAIEAWGAAIGLLVGEVNDPGNPIGTLGGGQVRIGGTFGPANVLGWAYYPGSQPIDGDVTFNLSQDWSKGFDLYSVALHEFGHAVADLDHGASPAMSAAYQGKLDGLTTADIAAARAKSAVSYSPMLVFNKVGSVA